MKPHFLWLLPGFIGFLSGCGPQSPTNSNPLRGIAASYVSARAFDRAHSALQRGNSSQLEQAGKQLRLASDAGSNVAITNAYTLVLAKNAGQLSMQAVSSQGKERATLLAESDQKYRAALEFAPKIAPEKELDAETLNGLGYFLADRGQSRADFEQAALLTRAAYEKLGRTSDLSNDLIRFSRASGAQDSYAWALFKLGKLDEARKQEEDALKTMRAIAPASISAEIPFHMAEIYSALGETDKARKELNNALQLGPDDELKAKIEARLKAVPT